MNWQEPDGSPTEEGEHPHYAIWDHEGRKWDVLADNPIAPLLAQLDEVETRSGHRPPAIAGDGHDCFLMNCHSLGPELERLRAQLDEAEVREKALAEALQWAGLVLGSARVVIPKDGGMSIEVDYHEGVEIEFQ